MASVLRPDPKQRKLCRTDCAAGLARVLPRAGQPLPVTFQPAEPHIEMMLVAKRGSPSRLRTSPTKLSSPGGPMPMCNARLPWSYFHSACLVLSFARRWPKHDPVDFRPVTTVARSSDREMSGPHQPWLLPVVERCWSTTTLQHNRKLLAVPHDELNFNLCTSYGAAMSSHSMLPDVAGAPCE